MGMWIQNYITRAFKPPCDISITFSDARTRKQVQCLYPDAAASWISHLSSAYSLHVYCWFLLFSFHRFQLRRTMGRQQWSLFSRAWKQYLEKYDFLVLTYLAWVMPIIKIRWNGFQVSIAPVPGKRIEHMGVKIELLGQIGMLSYPQLLLVLSVAC